MLLTILIWEIFLLLTTLVVIIPSFSVPTSPIFELTASVTLLALILPPIVLRIGYWLVGHIDRSYFIVRKLRRHHTGTVALHVNNFRNIRKLRTSPTDLEQAWNELIDRINDIANSDTQVVMQSHLFTRSKIRRLKHTFPGTRIYIRSWRMSGWQEGLFRATEICKQWRYPQIQDRGYMLVIRARSGKIISFANTITTEVVPLPQSHNLNLPKVILDFSLDFPLC
ncbi:hypothetical protein J8657_17630 [Dickeya oryzae]|uniref:Uncharacterized protein n=1 Tax=Dickeya oryzae TaxID=1240404 RepID=A0ABS5BG27_9GAMM|nr:hypothetical protein [Dickeya oryzae]MBP2859418.1 hypothetical protein [Dickeya oryzae]